MSLKKKRKKKKQTPFAILTSDWHIQEKTPVCRTDNFWDTQWGKLDWISDLQKKYDCLVIHAGDLFDKWNPSLHLLSNFIDHCPNKFYTVAGNHDLPQHNFELYEKCGVNILEQTNVINVFEHGHWGDLFTCPQVIREIGGGVERKIAVQHVMTWKDESPYPNCKAQTAKELLKKYPEFDLIVTGDNHKTFIEQYKNRILVNPGSIFRLTADQKEHRPCIFLYYLGTNTVQKINIPIDNTIISSEHLEKKKEKDIRINAFIQKLQQNEKIELNFEDNIKQSLEQNDIRKSVKQIINKALEL